MCWWVKTTFTSGARTCDLPSYTQALQRSRVTSGLRVFSSIVPPFFVLSKLSVKTSVLVMLSEHPAKSGNSRVEVLHAGKVFTSCYTWLSLKTADIFPLVEKTSWEEVIRCRRCTYTLYLHLPPSLLFLNMCRPLLPSHFPILSLKLFPTSFPTFSYIAFKNSWKLPRNFLFNVLFNLLDMGRSAQRYIPTTSLFTCRAFAEHTKFHQNHTHSAINCRVS